MRTINDLYIVCLKYKVKLAEVPEVWDKFQSTATRVAKIELETPYYVEVCAKYVRANK